MREKQPGRSSRAQRGSSLGTRLADAGLLALFLGLTFLLGVFPLKDTDFWWHLRAGDMIRESGQVPRVDTLTFGAEGRPWIDLHWGFDLLLSWGYEWGGVPGLNLAKCAITTLALLILVSARRPDWPIWAVLLGWFPAIFVLSGRMYVRPETLTLLWLACFLAVIFRWERRPWLAYALPVVQVLWVNTQGLFVLGPILISLALVDAVLRRGAFSRERRRWWKMVLPACALVGAACLFNPYFLRGALFPIELARTMSNPIFETTIAELMPVWSFIEAMGLRNLPIQLHMATIAVGALSFILPLLWRVRVRLFARNPWEGLFVPAASKPAAADGKTGRKARRGEKDAPSWGPGIVLRLLLFVAFSALSFKATRNSHQFATVVGTIIAWNIAAWAAEARRHAIAIRPVMPPPQIVPRLMTCGVLVLALVFVGSGAFYEWSGEGRTIGLGEEPHWFAHAAIKAAGGPGAPERFVCFHNGHAALYEYAYGPDRKVFADARLEVIGPEVYGRYLALEDSIRENHRTYANPGSVRPGVPSIAWGPELQAMGQPGVLVDLVHQANARLAATMFIQSDWSCIWFDGVAAVFVHESYPAAANRVDFARSHFRAESGAGPMSAEDALVTAKALANLVQVLGPQGHGQIVRPMIVYGMGLARRAREAMPRRFEPWKALAILEALREPPMTADRYRRPFDPIYDLSSARATYLLDEALKLAPDNASCLLVLAAGFQSRGMYEEALPLYERLERLDPRNQYRTTTAAVQAQSRKAAEECRAALGPGPVVATRNLDEYDRSLKSLLEHGRVRTAVELIEREYPVEGRGWDVTDQIATLWLHLGEPSRAREAWRAAVRAPQPALVTSRIAVTYYIEGNFGPARDHFQAAIKANSNLFEAHYGRAVLEQDSGNAAAARDAALRAVEVAPNPAARSAAQTIVDLVTPHA